MIQRAIARHLEISEAKESRLVPFGYILLLHLLCALFLILLAQGCLAELRWLVAIGIV